MSLNSKLSAATDKAFSAGGDLVNPATVVTEVKTYDFKTSTYSTTSTSVVTRGILYLSEKDVERAKQQLILDWPSKKDTLQSTAKIRYKGLTYRIQALEFFTFFYVLTLEGPIS